MAGKTLFFFTDSFPFGKREPFIAHELPFLEAAFERVVIVSNNMHDEQKRPTGAKISTVRWPYDITKIQKFLSLTALFSPLFWQELKIIRQTYHLKLSPIILKTMLVSVRKSWIMKRKIKNMISQEPSPILYSYWNNDMAMALAGVKQECPDVPCFSRMHRWDVYFEVNESKYLPYRKFIFDHLDRVFSISNHGKAYYKNLFPDLNHKISVAQLGVKNSEQNPNNTTGKLQLLSVSNMIPVKNLDALIEALALLKINFHWVHIGDGPLFKELEKKAGKLIPGQFTFKGRMPNYKVIDYMETNAVDLIVNVSFSEGIPVSIMEAFACGIPAIATDVGGNAEIVSSKSGFLLNENASPKEIADAIHNYDCLSPEQKMRYREEAYKTWKRNYNAEKNFGDMIETYFTGSAANGQG